MTQAERLTWMAHLHNHSEIYYFIGELHRLTDFTNDGEDLAEWFRCVTRKEGAMEYSDKLSRRRRTLNLLFDLMEEILCEMGRQTSGPHETKPAVIITGESRVSN